MKNLKPIMMYFNKRIMKLFIFTMVLAVHASLHAQNTQDPPPDDPNNNSNVVDPGPEPTPIDGGLTLLIAAGAAYGVKKYRDGKKTKTNEEPGVK